MSNMSADLGAKFAVFPYDQQTRDYLEGKLKRPARPVEPDVDALYETQFTLDLSSMTPQVSLPHDPSNSTPIETLEKERIKVQQAFIGSCTNGRMEDFRMAARILKGRKVHADVRLIATPASQSIWRQCLEEGIWEIFAESGALVTHSTCGACAGIQLGVLGDGETCISASARNYPGRMGSTKSAVYLANPATVAASALAGVITDPRRYL